MRAFGHAYVMCVDIDVCVCVCVCGGRGWGRVFACACACLTHMSDTEGKEDRTGRVTIRIIDLLVYI